MLFYLYFKNSDLKSPLRYTVTSHSSGTPCWQQQQTDTWITSVKTMSQNQVKKRTSLPALLWAEVSVRLLKIESHNNQDQIKRKKNKGCITINKNETIDVNLQSSELKAAGMKGKLTKGCIASPILDNAMWNPALNVLWAWQWIYCTHPRVDQDMFKRTILMKLCCASNYNAFLCIYCHTHFFLNKVFKIRFLEVPIISNSRPMYSRPYGLVAAGLAVEWDY